LSDSTETELTAIALALERAIDLYTSDSVNVGMNTVIFTDSKDALNTVIDSHVHGNYHQVIARIRPLLLSIIQISVTPFTPVTAENF